jgi:hypothetical protein
MDTHRLRSYLDTDSHLATYRDIHPETNLYIGAKPNAIHSIIGHTELYPYECLNLDPHTTPNRRAILHFGYL